jgi:diaminopimelate decarboxylase
MELLDVGGGFPSANINENVVDALKNTYNDPLGYKVIAEPGRHFSSNSCFLAIRVI